MSQEYCSRCGDTLDVVEMLDLSLSEVGEDSYCDLCRREMSYEEEDY